MSKYKRISLQYNQLLFFKLMIRFLHNAFLAGLQEYVQELSSDIPALSPTFDEKLDLNNLQPVVNNCFVQQSMAFQNYII